MTIKQAEIAIQNGDWQTASDAIDELLLDNSLSREDFIRTCYAQAYLLLKLGPAEFIIDKDDTPQIVGKMFKPYEDFKSTRNSLSFVMSGLDQAVEIQNSQLIAAGCNCFCQIASNISVSPGYAILLGPLSKVVDSLTHTENLDLSVRVALHLALADMLATTVVHSKEKESSVVLPGGVSAWPSWEALQQLWKSAQETVCKSINDAATLAKSNNLDQLFLHVVNTYLKISKVYPTWKCPTLDMWIKQEVKASTANAATDASAEKRALNDLGTLKVPNVAILLDTIDDLLVNGSITEAQEKLRKVKTIHMKPSIKIRYMLLSLWIEAGIAAKDSSELTTNKIKELLQKVNGVLSHALEIDCDRRHIKAGCMCCWQYLKDYNLLHPHNSAWICGILKTLCRISENVGGFDASVRTLFEYELAKCYEAQDVFSMATEHAEKAQKLCTNQDTLNDIEILLQKLWIKGNTFDGNLTPELKGLHFFFFFFWKMKLL
jgi:hypothetical protein